MLGQSIRALAVIAALVGNSILLFGQMSVEDLLSDYDHGVGVVERIYSGFPIKVTDRTKASYTRVKDSLRTVIGDGTSSFEDAFGCYLAWFQDHHLRDECGAQKKYMKGPIDYSAWMQYAPADVYRKVDDRTFLIRYSSCVWSARRIRWVKKAVKAFKTSRCEHLIFDLRGNKGGAAGTSDGFIELLFDHDGYYNGIEIRNTPSNIGFFRKTMRQDKYWQTHLDACEQSSDEFPVLFEPTRVHYDRISSTPLFAAVLIDNQTASAAEELIVVLRRVSDRVMVFGKDPSLGCLDYANPGTVTLPRSHYKFHVPLTRSLGLPETGIDSTGIVPDVTIECDDPEVLTDNIDEWTIWTSAWLSAHLFQELTDDQLTLP